MGAERSVPPHDPFFPVGPRNSDPRSGGSPQRVAGLGPRLGERNFGGRDHLRPEANILYGILHTPFAQVRGRSGRPTTWPQVFPALPPARTDRPALQTRGPLLRGRGSTPDRFGNTSGRRPPASRHTAPHYRVALAHAQCSRFNACLNVSAPPPVHGWGSAQRDRCPTVLRPEAALSPDVFCAGQGIVLVRPRSLDAPVAPATSGTAPGARAARPPSTYVQRNSR